MTNSIGLSNIFRNLVIYVATLSVVASPKFGGDKMFDFLRITLLFIKTPLKAQNDYIFWKLGGAWPLWPSLATPMGTLAP